MKKIIAIMVLIVFVIAMVYAQTGNWTARTGNGSARITALNTNGRVGIATTSPSSRLHIATGDGGLTTTYATVETLTASGTTMYVTKPMTFSVSRSGAIIDVTNTSASSGNIGLSGVVSASGAMGLKGTSSGSGGYGVYGTGSSTSYGGYFRSTSSAGIGLAAINTQSDGWTFSAMSTDNTTTTMGILGSGYVGIGASLASSDIDSLFTVKGGSIHGKKHLKVDSTTYTGLLNVSGTSTLTGSIAAGSTMTVASLATISGQTQINDAIVVIGDDTTETNLFSVSTNGDDVSEFLVFGRVQTSNATVTGIRTITQGQYTSRAYSFRIFAKDINDSTSGAYYERVAVFRRGIGAPTIIGSIQTPQTIESADATAWDVTIAANSNNAAIDIKVTGAAGKTVSWHAIIRYYSISDQLE